MSDDDYDDELPAISVNCSRNSFELNMPAAADVAAERARAAECERQLAALRAGDIDGQSASSGSSSEEVTAAINALVVQSMPKKYGPSFEKLLHPIIAQLTDKTFLNEYLEVLQDADEVQTKRLFHEMLSHLWSISTCKENSWTEQDILSVCAWLCCACVCEISVTAQRILQHLMYNVASEDQGQHICRIIQSANWDARSLVTLSSALRGAYANSNRTLSQSIKVVTDGQSDCSRICEENNVYADTILRAAAAKILNIELEDVAPVTILELTEWSSTSFKKIKPEAQYMMVQIAGVVLASICLGPQLKDEKNSEEMSISQDMSEIGSLLRALNVAPSNSAQSPEYLKVALAVSKLQLMFRTNK